MAPFAFALGVVLTAAPAPPPRATPDALFGAAQAAGADERARLLRGWASMGATGTPPPGLAEDAQAARDWALTGGRLRVFASFSGPGRVRVGVDDPALVVDRLDVWVRGDGGWARATRLEDAAAGRQAYAVAEGRPVRVDVVLEAPTGPLLLQQVLLDSTAPAPPPLPVATEASPPPAAPPPAAPAAEAASVPWWWVAVGVVAVGLAGAAAWQETR